MWRNHMTVGGQIEEGLSWAVDLFSKAFHDSSNVSVLFAHCRYYGHVFLLCFFTCLPIRSNCCPCRGRRTKSWRGCTPGCTDLACAMTPWSRVWRRPTRELTR